MLSDDIFHNILILLSTIIFGYIIYDKFFNNNNGKQRKNVNTKSYSTKDEKSIKNNNINISSNNNNNMVTSTTEGMLIFLGVWGNIFSDCFSYIIFLSPFLFIIIIIIIDFPSSSFFI